MRHCFAHSTLVYKDKIVSTAIRILGLLMFTITSVTAQVSSDYKPHPQPGFPQIIQASDYPTIKFIESLYTKISKLGIRRDYFQAGVACKVENQSVSFKANHDSTMKVILRMGTKKTVFLNNTRFNDSNVNTLCFTLFRVLIDLSKGSHCEGVRFGNLPNRSYKKRIIIEFKFTSKIVSLESDSNGPGNSERIYYLDFSGAPNSFFWHHDN